MGDSPSILYAGSTRDPEIRKVDLHDYENELDTNTIARYREIAYPASK